MESPEICARLAYVRSVFPYTSLAPHIERRCVKGGNQSQAKLVHTGGFQWGWANYSHMTRRVRDLPSRRVGVRPQRVKRRWRLFSFANAVPRIVPTMNDKEKEGGAGTGQLQGNF